MPHLCSYVHRLLLHPRSVFQYEHALLLGRIPPGMFALLGGQEMEEDGFPLLVPMADRWGARKGGIPPDSEDVGLPNPDLDGQFTE